MKNKKLYKEIAKEVRKYGLQDLTEIQVMDSIQTGNLTLKQAGAPALDITVEDERKWIVALVVAVWNSFNSSGDFQDHWIAAVDKVIPKNEQY